MTPPQPTALAGFLASCDIPCPACRYNLRDLKSDQCPECGLALSVRMLQGDVKLTRAWWVGFAPLAVIAWLAIPLIVFGVALAAGHLARGELVGGLASIVVAAVALWGGILELRWIRNAEVIVSRPSAEQWAPARLCWMLVIILSIAIAGTIVTS